MKNFSNLTRFTVTTFVVVASLCFSVIPRSTSATTESNDRTPRNTAKPASTINPTVEESFGKLPLSFEPNRGQVDKKVKFLSRGPGYLLLLSATEARLALKSSETLRMKLVGANHRANLSAESQLEGNSNYLIGNDKREWQVDIPNYSRVKVTEAYPGIDVLYYGSDQHRLEFDFLVKPGSDPATILLEFAGAQSIRVDETGSLRLQMKESEVVQPAPVIYQKIDGERTVVEGRFVLANSKQVKFEIGDYDRSQELVIDPQIIYGSHHGGSADDRGKGVAVDKNGNVFIVGQTLSTNLDVVGGIQGTNKGGMDAFIVKINPSGTSRIFSTYLGSDGTDFANAVAVTSDGKACITGGADSDLGSNFPTTSGAYQGGWFWGNGGLEVFVTQLNVAGNGLVYSSLLGGNDNDAGEGIALDAANKIYVSGFALSANFPRKNSNQGRPNDHEPSGFIAKFDPTQTGNDSLVYSNQIHGEGSGRTDGRKVAVTPNGVAFTMGETHATELPVQSSSSLPPFQSNNKGGQDAYLAKFSTNGDLIYLTYFGGNGTDVPLAIAVDENERVYLAGSTTSSAQTFPIRNAFDSTRNSTSDGFVAKFNADGTALFYSTFFSATAQNNQICGIAIDPGGDVYIAGLAIGALTLQPINGFQSNLADGNTFVAKIERTDATGTTTPRLLYFDRLQAGQPSSLAIDKRGNVYVVGTVNFALQGSISSGTFEPGFSGGPNDAFVLKVNSTFADTIGVYRPSTRQFLFRNSNSAGGADFAITFGASGDLPVVGDWTGDGVPDIVVYRPSTGQFLFRQLIVIPPFTQPLVMNLGQAGDLPVMGDWNGDGFDTPGVFRPSTGEWFLTDTRPSASNPTPVINVNFFFGLAGDLPFAGDFDGNASDGIGVFRPSTGEFFLNDEKLNNIASLILNFGTAGDLPVAGDWLGDGSDGIGVFRPSTGQFFLNNNNVTNIADLIFVFGQNGDIPLGGNWDGIP